MRIRRHFHTSPPKTSSSSPTGGMIRQDAGRGRGAKIVGAEVVGSSSPHSSSCIKPMLHHDAKRHQVVNRTKEVGAAALLNRRRR
jgi:hypothetical protein